MRMTGSRSRYWPAKGQKPLWHLQAGRDGNKEEGEREETGGRPARVRDSRVRGAVLACSHVGQASRHAGSGQARHEGPKPAQGHHATPGVAAEPLLDRAARERRQAGRQQEALLELVTALLLPGESA